MEKIWKIRAVVGGTIAILSIIIKVAVFSNRVAHIGDDNVAVASGEEDPGGDEMADMPPPVMPDPAAEAAATTTEVAATTTEVAATTTETAAITAPAQATTLAPTPAEGGGAATDELLAQAKTVALAAKPAEAKPAHEPQAGAPPGSSASADPMSPEALALNTQAAGSDAANDQAAASQDAAMQAAMEEAMNNDAAAGAESPDASDDPGGSPGAAGGGSGKAPSFRYPITGAQAFLDAVKAKDPQKLNDAVALRSRLESSAAHRSLFEQILDSSVSAETIQELADAFEGYKIMRQGAVEGTGHQDVILFKSAGKDNLQRALTMRKEKAGWKVSDFSGVRKFEGQNLRRMRGRGRGRGMRRR